MLILNSKNTILRKQNLRQNIIKSVLLIIMILSILSIKSFSIVKPTSEFYVNDYANLLSTETKNYIMNTNISLNNKTGAQIVVVTIPSLEGSSIEDYATQLFRNFGIGDKTKNNGVLLLLALEERKFRVEVGYGLEGVLPDGKTGRIQDEYIIPYLKNNNWDDGIRNGFSAILKVIEGEYNVDVGGEDISKYNQKETENVTKIHGISGISMIPISMFVGGVFRILNERKKVIFSFLYLSISSIFILISLVNYLGLGTLIIIGLNLIFFLSALGGNIYFRGGRFSGGGGGFSGCGGSFHGGRRLIWWRRKLKKFLIVM